MSALMVDASVSFGRRFRALRRARDIPRRASGRRQGGFSLIVALLMLIVIIILGVGASQMSINEERGARSDRDKQIAFQAAEAALKDAEYEILDPAALPCQSAEPGRGRPSPSYTCFNQVNSIGYALSCSAYPNEGLCDYDAVTPAWVDAKSSHIDFLADAKTAGGSGVRTVKFGRFTGRSYGSRETSGLSSLPVSRYPPRYIIELVPKNTAIESLAAGTHMFRITAMGFGANENTQVVLQSVVSTKE